MSEWNDNRNKLKRDFRKLLRERIEKANLRRAELTKEETTKLEKLEAIAARLKRGENVQNRQLQSWLSAYEYEQIVAEWDTQKLFREELKDKPSELKRYEDKLKEAIMMRNRSDAYHRKGKKAAAYKLDSKCENLCEEALEILQEIVAADASLQMWFDRNLDFGHGSLIDASIGNLPRLVTSRSIEKQRDDSRIVKKLDVNINVVERAIDNIGRDIEPKTSSAKSQLNMFLQICADRAASTVWQTFDTEEQVNKRTEECVWFIYALRRTVCECRLRKLLNCNSFSGVEKTCIVRSELHITYTRTIKLV